MSASAMTSSQDLIQRTQKSFNQALHSDVTIKVGDKQFFCHKFIICQASEYFAKLCGPDSRFKEKGSQEIELKDDDPEVLEYLLRGFYGFDDRPAAGEKPWRRFLQLHITADKYLLRDTSEAARAQFEATARSVTDLAEVVEILKTLDLSFPDDERAVKLRKEVHASKRTALMKCPKYREYLQENTERLWQDVDMVLHVTKQYAAEVERLRRFEQSLQARTVVTCGAHSSALETGGPPGAPVPAAGPNGVVPGNCALKCLCYGHIRENKLMKYYVPK